jgi:hypothetical protein
VKHWRGGNPADYADLPPKSTKARIEQITFALAHGRGAFQHP